MIINSNPIERYEKRNGIYTYIDTTDEDQNTTKNKVESALFYRIDSLEKAIGKLSAEIEGIWRMYATSHNNK